MKKKSGLLKAFRIFREGKTWVAHDPETTISSMGNTRKSAYDNLVEALRVVVLTYQDAGNKK